jgi:hypothetical protein
VPGAVPLDGSPVIGTGSGTSEVITDPAAAAAAGAGAMPAETDPAIVATPSLLAPPAFDLTEAEVALPGYR